jgi:hypothetical protein
VKRAVLMLLALLASSLARAQQPIIHAQLTPTNDILVGQPVHLRVTVLVPNYFTGSPDFPEFEVDNAIVVLPQDRPENSNERVGGLTYAGITETYTIYPQQPGDFRLPPAEVSVSYASAPPKSTVASLSLPPIGFHAEVPAAAAGLDYFLPTTQLAIQQKWSAPLNKLRAGDSIQRTIMVTAMKTQAMLIPPLPMSAPDGIRVYPDEPMVQDQKTDRGDFILGRRTQTAKYFLQKAGNYTLPPIQLQWWNLTANRLVTATLPAVQISVAANPNYVTELPPEPEPAAVVLPKHISFWSRYRFWFLLVAPSILVALAFFFLGWRYLPRVARHLHAWQSRREHSEAAYFHNLVGACRRNHAMEAYSCLLTWLASAYPGVTLHDFLVRANDPDLARETNLLGSALFKPSSQNSWRGLRFANLVKQHRWTRRRNAAKRSAISDLNP